MERLKYAREHLCSPLTPPRSPPFKSYFWKAELSLYLSHAAPFGVKYSWVLVCMLWKNLSFPVKLEQVNTLPNDIPFAWKDSVGGQAEGQVKVSSAPLKLLYTHQAFRWCNLQLTMDVTPLAKLCFSFWFKHLIFVQVNDQRDVFSTFR